MNIREVMESEGVKRITLYTPFGKIAVVLRDGRLGEGVTFADALADARRADAPNVEALA